MPCSRHPLHCGYLVLGAIRRPVGVLGRDYVGPSLRMMEGRIAGARGDSLGDRRTQRNCAGAARHFYPTGFVNAALLGVVRMDFEDIFRMPGNIPGAARLSTDVVLSENPAGSEYQWIARRSTFIGRNIL